MGWVVWVVRIIVSRWLITIGDDDVLLCMDDQLRDLGRQIICEEGLHLPGKQIRLWCSKEAMRVLEIYQKTEALESTTVLQNSLEPWAKYLLHSLGLSALKHLKFFSKHRLK